MKKILSLILALLFVFSTTGTVIAMDHLETEEQIFDIAYKYPITYNTEQWKSFTAKSERIQACHVSESVLEKMTTSALIETIITYPLFVDVFAYNTIEEGVKHVSKHFKGINILENRDDAIECLKMYYKKFEEDTNITREKIALKTLLKYLALEKNEIQPYVSYRTIYTPNDSPVLASYNATWADRGVTAEEAEVALQWQCDAYPSATLLRDASPKYNCHSYAWYSQSSTNKYWIGDPRPYMSDGSYTEQIRPAVDDIIYWENDDHSGILVGIGGNVQDPLTIISKWGMGGLFRHTSNDCPYEGTLSIWR